MKNLLYYGSAFCLAVLIYICLFPSKKDSYTRKNKYSAKKTSSQRNIENPKREKKTFADYLTKDLDSFHTGRAEFEAHTSIATPKEIKQKFAYRPLSTDKTSFSFVLEGEEKYQAYVNYRDTVLLYSEGTFFRNEDEGKTVYTFTSNSMSPVEGFYRDQKLNCSGTFFDNVNPVHWSDIAEDGRILESWRLIQNSNYFKDDYSKKIFKKSVKK